METARNCLVTDSLADPMGTEHQCCASRNFGEVLDEDRVRIDRLAAHFRDQVDVDLAAVHVGVKNRHAVGRARAVFKLGGAREQHDLVGDLPGGGPHLLAIDHVTARHFLREGLDRGGVEAGVRFGEAEAALVGARHQWRHPALRLLGCGEHHNRVRPEQVDVHRRGRRHAAAVAAHLVHHDCRFSHPQT